MKKIAFSLLTLALVFSQGVFAQRGLDKGASEPAVVSQDGVVNDATDMTVDDLVRISSAEKAKQMAKTKTMELDKAVGLSEDQKQKIYDINRETFLAAKDLKAGNPDADRDALKLKAVDLLNSRNAQLKEVLTEEQYTSLMQGTTPSDIADRGKKTSDKQMRELDEVVSLSDDQKDQIMEINQNLYQKAVDFRNEHPDASVDKVKEYKKSLMKERLAGYRDVLTEDQINLFLEHRKSTGAQK